MAGSKRLVSFGLPRHLLSWVIVKLKTAKNGWPALRFRQCALRDDSFQAPFGTGKL